jgi:hypothetical protein
MSQSATVCMLSQCIAPNGVLPSPRLLLQQALDSIIPIF